MPEAVLSRQYPPHFYAATHGNAQLSQLYRHSSFIVTLSQLYNYFKTQLYTHRTPAAALEAVLSRQYLHTLSQQLLHVQARVSSQLYSLSTTAVLEAVLSRQYFHTLFHLLPFFQVCIGCTKV